MGLRSIWLTQLSAIGPEYLPHTSPHQPLSSLSPEQLKVEVLNLTHLQGTLEAYNGLKLVKEKVISFESPSLRVVEPRIVPGAREVFLVQLGRLELWSLQRHERICAAPSPTAFPYCTAIDIDLSSSRDAIMLVARYSSGNGGPGTRDR